MKFSLLTAALATLVAASPVSKRQAVFSTTAYDDLSISGGTAGNAQQEALDVLGPLPADLTTVEQSDIDFLDRVNTICNEAETEAFNPAIDAADGEEADALQRGKIKNKVLKLTATILKLQIQQAQGADHEDRIAAEEVKLNNNISQDEDEAGEPSTFLSFNASTD